MKGTAARLADRVEADAAAAAALAADPKQRAENLMIVDLMRNDLSRVAVPGSVTVPALFTVERYPTVHQMTSTVTATLAPGRRRGRRDRRAVPLRIDHRRAQEARDGDRRRGRGAGARASIADRHRADRCGWARCRVERDVQRRDPDADHPACVHGDDRAGIGHRRGLGQRRTNGPNAWRRARS